MLADLGDAQGAGTITNDDPAPGLSIDDATVAEGNSGTVSATFTVSLDAASGQSVTVDYATADGTGTAPGDYGAVNNTLTFAAGETAKQVTVLVNGDLLDEIDETFSVNLTNPINATLSDAQGLGTITDDDPLPAVAIDDVTVTEQDTGTVTASFNVTLVPASGRMVSVHYATADGTATAPADYSATGGDLVFAAGEATKQVTVLVHSDTLDEIDESFTVGLSNAADATIADGLGSGTIGDDDDPPSLSIGDVTVTEGGSGTTAANFEVSLSAASGRTVSVNYASADGTATAPSDYAPAGGTLNFAVGQTTKQVMVNVNGDLTDELNETFTVTLSGAVNATLLDALGLATITDDDGPPSLSINDVTVTETSGTSANAVFDVTLSSASEQPVSVGFATADGTAIAGADYTSASGTVNFSAGQTDADDHRPGDGRRARRVRRELHRHAH